jgi:hypothetical protein
MQLPEIHDAQRLVLNPDDVLVLRNTEVEIYQDEARLIEAQIRRHFGLPDLNVMVLGRDWEVTVVEGDAE